LKRPAATKNLFKTGWGGSGSAFFNALFVSADDFNHRLQAGQAPGCFMALKPMRRSYCH
jgi:hypothetical protein